MTYFCYAVLCSALLCSAGLGGARPGVKNPAILKKATKFAENCNCAGQAPSLGTGSTYSKNPARGMEGETPTEVEEEGNNPDPAPQSRCET